MAKKQSPCQSGSVTHAVSFTARTADVITFSTWICAGAVEVHVWIDPEGPPRPPDHVVSIQATDVWTLPTLGKGVHQIFWSILSPSKKWECKTEIDLVPAATSKPVVIDLRKQSTEPPPVFGAVEVVIT